MGEFRTAWNWLSRTADLQEEAAERVELSRLLSLRRACLPELSSRLAVWSILRVWPKFPMLFREISGIRRFFVIWCILLSSTIRTTEYLNIPLSRLHASFIGFGLYHIFPSNRSAGFNLNVELAQKLSLSFSLFSFRGENHFARKRLDRGVDFLSGNIFAWKFDPRHCQRAQSARVFYRPHNCKM